MAVYFYIFYARIFLFFSGEFSMLFKMAGEDDIFMLSTFFLLKLQEIKHYGLWRLWNLYTFWVHVNGFCDLWKRFCR